MMRQIKINSESNANRRANTEIDIENDFLLLKPLYDITDKDIMEDSRILRQPFHSYKKYLPINKSKILGLIDEDERIDVIDNIYFEDVICAIDYLRSNGYALKWNGIRVNEMVKFKWIRLNATQNENKH